MTVILGGLMVGYTARKSGRAKEEWGSFLNRIALTYIQPFVIGIALWSMKAPDLKTLALPVFGFVLIVAMWPISALVARLMHMDRAKTGSFVTASMFSNVGFTYGTFVAFVLLGAQGAALASLYCVCFMPSLFTLGFYVARLHSPGKNQSPWEALIGVFNDAQTRNPILGIVAGLLLNVFHVPALPASAFIIDVCMPLTTATFLIAIGLGMHLSAVREYWRECLMLHGMKFVISPIVGLGLAWLFGYWQMGDHSLLQVVFIQSATPSGIMVVMLADVFDLNRKLAGALWLTTNITGTFLAPIIILVARSL